MTSRTEAYQPTPIEQATKRALEMFSEAVSVTYKVYRVQSQHGTTEAEFRRILALYLHDKSLTDWCADLQIEDASDPGERR